MARRTGDALAALAVAALAAAPVAAAPAAVEGEVRVEASADRDELALDETLTLTVRIEAEDAPASVDLGEAKLPFTVVSREESRTSSFAFGTGGFRRGRTTVLRITLSPKRPGDLVIPPIVAVVNGARRETAPIFVKVVAAGPRPPSAAAPPERRGGAWRGWERDLALEVEVDRREVFVGEQAIATVWLLSPAGVVAYEQFRPPAYDGFWMEEIEAPRRLVYRVRTVNGVPTRAYLLQRIALFPTRAGEATLGPYQLDVAVRVGPDALLSPFQDVRRARRRSAPVVLRVKPLPPGAPKGFDAANVGRWKLEATTTGARVAAGEPIAVRVKVSGDGNVRALAPPRLPEVPGTRRFEPTVVDDVAASAGRSGGSRTVETVLVPAGAGVVTIPPLEWPFFDPRSGRYEVARTRALRVEVLPGAAPAPPAAATGVAALAAALGPLRGDGALAPRAPPPWRRPPFLAVVALPPLLLAALVLRDEWRRRAAAGATGRRARGAGGIAARPLCE